MKKVILVLLTALLISLPQLSLAMTPDYFLLCKEVETMKGKIFPRGTLFKVAQYPKTSTEPIKVMSGGLDDPRLSVNPEFGFYFRVGDAFNFTRTLSLPPVLIKNAELIETACGQHNQEFSIGGNTFTDLKIQLVEKDSQQKSAYEASKRKEKEEQEQRQRELQAEEKERLRMQEEEREYAKAEKVAKEKSRVKQAEADQRKQAKLAKYNVKAEVSAADLRKNPFQFEGKVILLTGVSFDRMLEKGLAVFAYNTSSMEWVGDLSRGRPVVSSSTQELLVSKVPVDFSKGYTDLIVKCKGTTKATNNLGATITLPFVEYIAVCE